MWGYINGLNESNYLNELNETSSINDLSDSITNRSMYKQFFCYYDIRDKPNDFIYKNTNILQDILEFTRERLDNDDRFGKIIYTYLCFPSYFSIHDYNILLNYFEKIEYDLQIDITMKIYHGSFYIAIGNVMKYEHGIKNLFNLVNRFPFIKNNENNKFYEKFGYKLDDFLLNIFISRLDKMTMSFNELDNELFTNIYGSIDEFYEKNIENMVIEI